MLLSLQSMLLIDGFHGVFLSLYIGSSHICVPPRQQLCPSLSVANGFLIESPQVVYLFVEVKWKQCGQDTDLCYSFGFLFAFCHLTVNSRKQCPRSISGILCLHLVFTPLLLIQCAIVSCSSSLTYYFLFFRKKKYQNTLLNQ